MKRKMKKLTLARETVLNLDRLENIHGGVQETYTCGFNCQVTLTPDPKTIANQGQTY
jgi:hypothetical protein